MATQGKTILITGGAGFIGTHLARHFAGCNSVIIVDNLSRRGADVNLRFLKDSCDIHFFQADVSDPAVRDALLQRLPRPDVVLHLAAQVAVTTSVEDPETDFRSNALGTFNILEYARRLEPKPVLIFSSTNKVYGALEHIEVAETKLRYDFRSIDGIDESCPLDFHSPYGCSKGCADQYVADYARIYGLPTVVFRQSCIYGEHQFGVEDQGWVAWFLIAALLGRPITVYGNGKQVRDLLHVSDLVRAFELAIERIDSVEGQVFNLGGGMGNSLSLLEFFAFIRSRFGLSPELSFGDIRAGDQKIFISRNGKSQNLLSWRPEVPWQTGIEALHNWIRANIGIIRAANQGAGTRLAA